MNIFYAVIVFCQFCLLFSQTLPSDVNKDFSLKDQDQDKDLSCKDKDKDFGLKEQTRTLKFDSVQVSQYFSISMIMIIVMKSKTVAK